MTGDRNTVLLSAYACFDNFGSEPGVGYTWLQMLLESGYKVTLATSEWSYMNLKADSVTTLAMPNLSFIVIGTREQDKFFRKNRLIYQIYLMYWQCRLFFTLRRRKMKWHFIHHLTYGGVTIPSLIASFADKSIYGPVGGSENAPLKLAVNCGVAATFKEVFKKSYVFLMRFEPLLWYTRKSYHQILLKNRDNLPFYASVGHKCLVKSEIAANTSILNAQISVKQHTNYRVIFSARGLYWKGGALAIKIAKYVHEVMDEANFVFEFYGSGPEYSRWKLEAAGCDYIHFFERLPQPEYFEKVMSADCMIFPSFHDSSGNVILEALCNRIPVVALDLGGPSSIISHSQYLVNPTMPFNKILESFALKTITAAKLSASEKEKLAQYYVRCFASSNLLKEVYE